MKMLLFFLALHLAPQWNPDSRYPLRIEILQADYRTVHDQTKGSGKGNISIYGEGSRYQGFVYFYDHCPAIDKTLPDQALKARWVDYGKKMALLLPWGSGECEMLVNRKPFTYAVDQNGRVSTYVQRHE